MCIRDRDLNDVIGQIKNRNYKFIIYMDDLSFEDFEIEYKYLKAVIEGGLEKKPANVLIYATSNRRHLVREKFSDKRELDDDLHNNDTVQEDVYKRQVWIIWLFWAIRWRRLQRRRRGLSSREAVWFPAGSFLRLWE